RGHTVARQGRTFAMMACLSCARRGSMEMDTRPGIILRIWIPSWTSCWKKNVKRRARC
ncbi:hypothetical protein C0992_003379, partial [Termitomyces sp. T32_za158]